jgi:hypothetical protein
MKPTFKLCLEGKLLRDYLAKAIPGDKFPYESLKEIVGCDVQKKRRYLLDQARAWLSRHKGLEFGTINGYGIKCLEDTEIIDTAEHKINSIQRQSKKSAKKLVNVKDFEKLSNEHRIKAYATNAILGCISQFTKRASMKQISETVQSQEKLLPITIERTLKMFTNPKEPESE